MEKPLTIFCTRFPPDPNNEAEGPYIRVLIYRPGQKAGEGEQVTFSMNYDYQNYMFFSQFCDIG
jgi:hypothetical protein